jgi:uncharacterized Zn finger protein
MIRLQCRNCGSTQIEADAVVSFDERSQRWDQHVERVFQPETMRCGDCGCRAVDEVQRPDQGGYHVGTV